MRGTLRDVAVTIEQPTTRRSRFTNVEAAVFAIPVWLLTAATLIGATLLFGRQWSTSMWEQWRVARDPFTQAPGVGSWRYSSPLSPMLSWAVGARWPEAIANVDYLTNAALIAGCVFVVARFASSYAARLFLFAYWCSPNSWAGTAQLGLVDTWTLFGLTVCMVAPAGWCFGAGVLLGFNHFEQAAISMVAVAVIRCLIRRESWTPIAAGIGGMLVGKAMLMWYLVANGIETTGRLAFIRDKGVGDLFGGWRGHELVLLLAVYNVMWVAVIWMAAKMGRRDRWIVIGLQAFLTLPVLFTYDLSRVYRTVTWPIVILLVIYAAEWPDRRLVQRAALLLAVAAIFVPRTEIWHGGLVMN